MQQKTIEQWIASDKDYENESVEFEDQKIPKITPQIKEALQKFKSLKKLYIVACNLRTLENFPSILTLEELDLADNKLKGDQLVKLPVLPNLKRLTLTNNLIMNADDLKHLATFNKSLVTLNVDGCPLAKKVDYRKQVFKTVGGVLNVVDMEDQKGRELAQDSDEEQDDDEENQDDQDDIISDEDQESAPLPGKRPAPRGSSGKKQQAQIEDSDQDQKENQEDSQDQEDEDNEEEDEEFESEAEDKGPRKQTKRS